MIARCQQGRMRWLVCRWPSAIATRQELTTTIASDERRKGCSRRSNVARQSGCGERLLLRAWRKYLDPAYIFPLPHICRICNVAPTFLIAHPTPFWTAAYSVNFSQYSSEAPTAIAPGNQPCTLGTTPSTATAGAKWHFSCAIHSFVYTALQTSQERDRDYSNNSNSIPIYNQPSNIHNNRRAGSYPQEKLAAIAPLPIESPTHSFRGSLSEGFKDANGEPL